MSRRLSLDLATQCKAAGLPEPVREFSFHPTRKWRFDWAWPACKVAVEQEGVTYQRGSHQLGGRHVSARGFRADTEKYGEAFALGWRVLRCLPEQIQDGQALSWLERVLERWCR